MLKICNAVYWLALAIWLGVLIAAGAAAVSAFTTLPDPELGVRLGAFEQYDVANHGRLAAGFVTEPIFTFADIVQAAAGIIVVVLLALQFTVFRMNWRGPANVIRTSAIVIALALFAWRAVAIMPEMNRDLRAYREAARAGEIAMAQQHFDSFNVGHRRARPLMNAGLVLVLVAIAASGAAMTSGRPVSGQARYLETPRLMRRS